MAKSSNPFVKELMMQAEITSDGSPFGKKRRKEEGRRKGGRKVESKWRIVRKKRREEVDSP